MKNLLDSLLAKIFFVSTIGAIVASFTPQFFLFFFDPHFSAWANNAACASSTDIRCIFPFVLTIALTSYTVFFATAFLIYRMVKKKNKKLALKYIIASVLLILILGKMNALVMFNNPSLSRLVAIAISPVVYGIFLKLLLKNKKNI